MGPRFPAGASPFARGSARRVATPNDCAPDVLSPRIVGVIQDLTNDWRRLDEALSAEIEGIALREVTRSARTNFCSLKSRTSRRRTAERLRPGTLPVAADRCALFEKPCYNVPREEIGQECFAVIRNAMSRRRSCPRGAALVRTAVSGRANGDRPARRDPPVRARGARRSGLFSASWKASKCRAGFPGGKAYERQGTAGAPHQLDRLFQCRHIGRHGIHGRQSEGIGKSGKRRADWCWAAWIARPRAGTSARIRPLRALFPARSLPTDALQRGLGSESRRRFYSRAGDVSCIRGLSSLRAKNLVQSGKVGETEGIATPRLAPTQTAVYSNL